LWDKYLIGLLNVVERADVGKNAIGGSGLWFAIYFNLVRF
jgi:hypothetical protein